LVPHAQAPQRHARQEAAGSIGQEKAGAVLFYDGGNSLLRWWKFSKAGGLDGPMMLKRAALRQKEGDARCSVKRRLSKPISSPDPKFLLEEEPDIRPDAHEFSAIWSSG
jgi:hypothetical protein